MMDAVNNANSSAELQKLNIFGVTGEEFKKMAFPYKLYDMLEMEPREIVEWLPHGQSFRINDLTKFANSTSPKYFKHTKMESFQRQLNLYGFRRIIKGDEEGAYKHPQFQRGKPDALPGIRRIYNKPKIMSPMSGTNYYQNFPEDNERSQSTTPPPNDKKNLEKDNSIMMTPEPAVSNNITASATSNAFCLLADVGDSLEQKSSTNRPKFFLNLPKNNDSNPFSEMSAPPESPSRILSRYHPLDSLSQAAFMHTPYLPSPRPEAVVVAGAPSSGSVSAVLTGTAAPASAASSSNAAPAIAGAAGALPPPSSTPAVSALAFPQAVFFDSQSFVPMLHAGAYQYLPPGFFPFPASGSSYIGPPPPASGAGFLTPQTFSPPTSTRNYGVADLSPSKDSVDSTAHTSHPSSASATHRTAMSPLLTATPSATTAGLAAVAAGSSDLPFTPSSSASSSASSSSSSYSPAPASYEAYIREVVANQEYMYQYFYQRYQMPPPPYMFPAPYGGAMHPFRAAAAGLDAAASAAEGASDARGNSDDAKAASSPSAEAPPSDVPPAAPDVPVSDAAAAVDADGASNKRVKSE